MVGALILGLLAGAIARLVIPGDAFEQLEGWKSWAATLVLGLVGAFVGWLIFAGLLGIDFAPLEAAAKKVVPDPAWLVKGEGKGKKGAAAIDKKSASAGEREEKEETEDDVVPLSTLRKPAKKAAKAKKGAR